MKNETQSSKFIDYYAILQISQHASNLEIKNACRTQLKLAHPDAGGQVDTFIFLKKIYDVLTNPEKRKNYDLKYNLYYYHHNKLNNTILNQQTHIAKNAKLNQDEKQEKNKLKVMLKGILNMKFYGWVARCSIALIVFFMIYAIRANFENNNLAGSTPSRNTYVQAPNQDVVMSQSPITLPPLIIESVNTPSPTTSPILDPPTDNEFKPTVASIIETKKSNYKVVRFLNGDLYDGELVNGQISGTGTLKTKFGDIYEGQWVKGLRSGLGKYMWSNGNRYEGPWIDDQMSGYGILSMSNGDEYEGQFSNGEKNGEGFYIWKNGDRYSGQWLDGYMSGEGTFIWADGSKYEGSWGKNLRNGHGTFYAPDGTRMFEGLWVDDQFVNIM